MSTDFPPYKDYRIRVEALDLLPDGWKWDAWISPMSGKLANREILVISHPPDDTIYDSEKKALQAGCDYAKDEIDGRYGR